LNNEIGKLRITLWTSGEAWSSPGGKAGRVVIGQRKKWDCNVNLDLTGPQPAPVGAGGDSAELPQFGTRL
jgi:hypothetical protein